MAALQCSLSHSTSRQLPKSATELQSPTLAQQQDLHQQSEVRFRHSDCPELCQQVAGKSATTELKHSSSAGSWEETAKGSGNDTKAGTGRDQGDWGASSKCRVMLPFSARRASAMVRSSCDRTLSTEAGTWLRLLKQRQLSTEAGTWLRLLKQSQLSTEAGTWLRLLKQSQLSTEAGTWLRLLKQSQLPVGETW